MVGMRVGAFADDLCLLVVDMAGVVAVRVGGARTLVVEAVFGLVLLIWVRITEFVVGFSVGDMASIGMRRVGSGVWGDAPFLGRCGFFVFGRVLGLSGQCLVVVWRFVCGWWWPSLVVFLGCAGLSVSFRVSTVV